MLEDLLAALDFLLDRKSRPKDAAVLHNVRAHLRLGSHDGLALGLETVAELASRHRRDLAALPGVDLAMLGEARRLAAELRDHSAAKLSSIDPRAGFRDARGRVARLLHERMTAARAAIRFCFRAHPELVARATSEYRRQKRASQRAGRGKEG